MKINKSYSINKVLTIIISVIVSLSAYSVTAPQITFAQDVTCNLCNSANCLTPNGPCIGGQQKCSPIVNTPECGGSSPTSTPVPTQIPAPTSSGGTSGGSGGGTTPIPTSPSSGGSGGTNGGGGGINPNSPGGVCMPTSNSYSTPFCPPGYIAANPVACAASPLINPTTGQPLPSNCGYNAHCCRACVGSQCSTTNYPTATPVPTQTVYNQPTATPVPTQTVIRQPVNGGYCGRSCSTYFGFFDTCSSATDGCNVCNSSTNTCVSTSTPTPTSTPQPTISSPSPTLACGNGQSNQAVQYYQANPQTYSWTIQPPFMSSSLYSLYIMPYLGKTYTNNTNPFGIESYICPNAASLTNLSTIDQTSKQIHDICIPKSVNNIWPTNVYPLSGSNMSCADWQINYNAAPLSYDTRTTNGTSTPNNQLDICTTQNGVPSKVPFINITKTFNYSSYMCANTDAVVLAGRSDPQNPECTSLNVQDVMQHPNRYTKSQLSCFLYFDDFAKVTACKSGSSASNCQSTTLQNYNSGTDPFPKPVPSTSLCSLFTQGDGAYNVTVQVFDSHDINYGSGTLWLTWSQNQPVCPTPTSSPTPTPTITPTPVPACGTTCSNSNQCAGSTDGCSYCNPTTNQCQTPIACGTSCNSANGNADCANATGGCTTCNPSTNKCQTPPIECGTSCNSANGNADCANATGGCTTCQNGICSQPSQTQLAFTVYLHGIGQSGDNATTLFSLSNQSPQPATTSAALPFNRVNPNIYVYVYDSSNNPVGSANGITGTLNYNSTAGDYIGTVNLGSIPTGDYVIKAKMDDYLEKTFAGNIHIVSGQTVTVPTQSMTAGDINGDNQLDLQDYNALLDCGYGDLSPLPMTDPNSTYNSPACQAHANRALTDIDADGVVDNKDYNLFVRELSVQNGQNIPSQPPQNASPTPSLIPNPSINYNQISPTPNGTITCDPSALTNSCPSYQYCNSQGLCSPID